MTTTENRGAVEAELVPLSRFRNSLRHFQLAAVARYSMMPVARNV